MLLLLLILILLTAGVLLFLLGTASRRRGLPAGFYPIRALMGWCFIWVLERLLAENLLPESYRWMYLLVGIAGSIGWYLYVWFKMRKDPGEAGLQKKMDEIGRREE